MKDKARQNSFDVMRFFAASLVVFSHSFALLKLNEPHIGTITLGGFGVWMFFILSGYLIAASWKQYPRTNVFFAKRALRIFPGLLTALFVTVVVCGLFYTSLGLFAFFTNGGTLSYFNNILLINTQYSLPGVFTHLPYPDAANGSLWTLAYEFLMYIAVAVFGLTGMLRKHRVLKIWSGLFLLQIIISFGKAHFFDFSFLYFQFNLLVMLALMFFSGVVAQQYIQKITYTYVRGVLCLALFLIISTVLPTLSVLCGATLLAYALFAIGRSSAMSWFGRYGDFSYGIYIYSFPIQQMLIASLNPSSPYKLFVAALGLSITAGALSWHLVESRFLKLKSRINLKKYPLPQTDVAW